MTINYGKCSMVVVGLDMNCPLCGVLVKSGGSHDCETPRAKCAYMVYTGQYLPPTRRCARNRMIGSSYCKQHDQKLNRRNQSPDRKIARGE